MYNRYRRSGNLSDDEAYTRISDEIFNDPRAKTPERDRERNQQRERDRERTQDKDRGRERYRDHDRSREKVRPERTAHENRGARGEKKGSLSKNPIGGLLSKLNFSDWDTGDILLLLILILLIVDGDEDNEELIIALALVLFMGM